MKSFHAEVGSGQTLLKLANRMALVRQLCVRPGLSRVDLADAVGLTKSTVGGLVRELLEEGWLVEREVVATGDLGRRPTPLFIDETRLLLLGAEVDSEAINVELTTLTGEVQARLSAPHDASPGARASMRVLTDALLDACSRLGEGRRVVGIGVGLPGGVDETSGRLIFAPNLGWRDAPFGEQLRRDLRGTRLTGVPVFVQNEAGVAALGELEFNPFAVADPLLYVGIGDGVGAGVISGGRPLVGARGFAGEVGHMILQPGGPRCACGRRGCVEALIGRRAILAACGAADMDELRTRLSRRDEQALQAVEAAGSCLGVLLQNLTAAYDPACIVLGGAVVGLGEAFLKPARQTLGDYAGAAGVGEPPLRVARFGTEAVAVGAAALARHRMTRPALAR